MPSLSRLLPSVPYCLLIDGMMLSSARQVLSEADANVKFNAACALVATLQQLATAWRKVLGMKKDESLTKVAVLVGKGSKSQSGTDAPVSTQRGGAVEEVTAKTKRKASSSSRGGDHQDAAGPDATGGASIIADRCPPFLRTSDRVLLMEVVWSNLDENVWQTARTVSDAIAPAITNRLM